MAPYGFNIRDTVGFVTDPAGFIFVNGGTHTFPTTLGGRVCGFVAAPFGTKDDNAAINARIAGCNYVVLGDGGVLEFKHTLASAGTWPIRLAVGSDVFAGENLTIQIYDGATLKATITGNQTAGNFIDANGNIWSSAAWPGSNTARNITFATTSLRVVVTTSDNRAILSHVGIDDLVTGGTATQLGITTQPAGATSGSAFTTQPVVEIRDAGGALVSSSTANVTATITSGSGVLIGTVTKAAVAGVATFTDLGITGTGAHVITFTSSGLSSIAANSITVNAAVSNTGQLTAVVKDAGNNVLTGRPIIWASSNPAVATVNSSGLVTKVAAGSCNITATCEGVTSNACAVTVT